METYPVEYTKYRWFFTKSKKCVVGGKSSLQNDELLRALKKTGNDYLVMHTTLPGSPFAVILADPNTLTPSDLQETAIFTGCFSRAWRSQKNKTTVDIFSMKQLYKSAAMKTGTWGVNGKVQRKEITLALVLIKQEKKLRAVPETTARQNQILARLKPGAIDKQHQIPKFQVLLPDQFTQEEVLSALPAGGVTITKP